MSDEADTLALDNQAVVDYGPTRPHREASDMDYRLQLADLAQKKKSTFRWVRGHREEHHAADDKDLADIRENNEVDRLAKLATSLPIPDAQPTAPHSIHLAGAEAPTPAKKWVVAVRRSGAWAGCHWTTWLPMRGTRRMIWVTWLWGNARWEGCAAPRVISRICCVLCGMHHGQTVHARLVQCLKWKDKFIDAWVQTWEEWQSLARTWISTATPEDLKSISMLRIPLSFVEAIPEKAQQNLRQRVSWHQYHMLYEVLALRRNLPMPPRQDPPQQQRAASSVSAWYQAVPTRTVVPNPTPGILEEQTLYKPRKGKQAKVSTWHLTEAQARVRLLHLEAKPCRTSAIRLYAAISRSWVSAGTLRAKLHRIIAAPWNPGGSPGAGVGKPRAELATVDPRMHLTGSYLASARGLVTERWNMCNTALREFHAIHYKAAQWIAWWQVGEANVYKLWRCKGAHLLQCQGSKLRREHRKALEEIFLETTLATNRTYHSDAFERIVLTGPGS